MSTSAIRSWMIVSSLRTVLWFIQRVVPASIFVNIKSRAFSRASRCSLISLVSLTATPPLRIRLEVDPCYQPHNHNANAKWILTSDAHKHGPAEWEEADPSIMSLVHVPDEGEWRIAQTARGNRKGPESIYPTPRCSLGAIFAALEAREEGLENVRGESPKVLCLRNYLYLDE